MQERNRHLAEHSGVCLCYLISQRSGTAYTANYAKQQGLRVLNLAFKNKGYPWGVEDAVPYS